MKTVSLGVENLCIPCYAHCRYCLLSSCGKATGVDYERGKRIAKRIYDEIQTKCPELGFFYYIGYCMDDENLIDYIRFTQKIESPSGHFLQLNGLRLRDETETNEFISELVGAGIKLIDLTFYGMQEYHDRFAGRAGDFDFLLRILKAVRHHGLKVRFSIPVTKENLSQLDELVGLLEQYQTGEISVFLPHRKGRGRSLDALRLTADDLDRLSDRVRAYLSNYRTESEWLASENLETPDTRVLTLSLTPDNIEKLEAMTLEEILTFLEELDDRYYAALPAPEELVTLYGNKVGTRLYRRLRDLQMEWQHRYLEDNNIKVWDMNDETHHFSVRQ